MIIWGSTWPPFCKGRSEKEAFQRIVDMLASKLAGWKMRNLSKVGRGVLIKFVAKALPSYTMQTTLLLQGICDQMDNLMWDFLWGYNDDHRRHCILKLGSPFVL